MMINPAKEIICLHKKNDFFGEMSLLDGKTAPATVSTHENELLAEVIEVLPVKDDAVVLQVKPSHSSNVALPTKVEEVPSHPFGQYT